MIKYVGITSVVGLLVYGQIAPPELPLAGWSNVSAIGLLMFLLWWVVVKQQPKERDAARDHTERVVDKVGKQFADVQKIQHADQVALTDSVTKLAENCARHLQIRD